MKIYSLEEYKGKFKTATIEDYLNYLEEKGKEINITKIEAKGLGFSEKVISDLDRQYVFIQNLIKAVKKSMNDIVLRTIENMSLEELNILYKEEEKKLSDTVIQLSNELNKIKTTLDYKKEQYAEELVQEGKAKENYETLDAEKFFKDMGTKDQFVFNLLKDNDFDEDSFVSKLEETLIDMAPVYKMSLDDATLNHIVQEILKYIKKYRKVISMLNSVDDSVVYSLLNNVDLQDIFKIFEPSIDRKEVLQKILAFMQFEPKLDNELYASLSDDLKVNLCLEEFRGNTYSTLKERYESVIRGEKIAPETTEEIDGLTEEVERLTIERDAFSDKLVRLGRMKNSRDALRGYFKEEYQDKLKDEEKGTYSTLIEKMIVKTNEKKEEKRKQLRLIYDKIEANNKIADEVNHFIGSIENSTLFDVTEAKSRKQYLESEEGIHLTHVYIDPILSSEEKRLEQMEVMMDAQKEFESLEKEIKVMKNPKNPLKYILKYLSKKYQSQIDSLEGRYYTLGDEVINRLRKKELLEVNSERLAMGATFKNPIRTRDSRGMYPRSYGELARKVPALWQMNKDEYNEMAMYSIFDTVGTYSNVQEIFERRNELIEKLYNFEKVGGEYYQYSISHCEMKQLIEDQEKVISILRALRSSRSEKYQELERKVEKYNFSDFKEKIDEIAIKFGINGDEISKQTLVDFYVAKKKENEELSARIDELKKELNENETLVEKIDSIETIQEAEQLKAMLEGLDTYCVTFENAHNQIKALRS